MPIHWSTYRCDYANASYAVPLPSKACGPGPRRLRGHRRTSGLLDRARYERQHHIVRVKNKWLRFLAANHFSLSSSSLSSSTLSRRERVFHREELSGNDHSVNIIAGHELLKTNSYEVLCFSGC